MESSCQPDFWCSSDRQSFAHSHRATVYTRLSLLWICIQWKYLSRLGNYQLHTVHYERHSYYMDIHRTILVHLSWAFYQKTSNTHALFSHYILYLLHTIVVRWIGDPLSMWTSVYSIQLYLRWTLLSVPNNTVSNWLDYQCSCSVSTHLHRKSGVDHSPQRAKASNETNDYHCQKESRMGKKRSIVIDD